MIDTLIIAAVLAVIVIGGAYLTVELEVAAQEAKHHDAHND
jgi:multisubunit Na+/H+ antiporter MnhC subunit